MSDYNDFSKPTTKTSTANEESKSSVIDTPGIIDQNSSNRAKEETSSSKPFTSWYNRSKNHLGAGLTYKFTNFDNRLIRWILEKQGFKESV